MAIFDGETTLVPVNNIFCIGANVTLARKTVDFGALFDLSSPPPPFSLLVFFSPPSWFSSNIVAALSLHDTRSFV